MQRYDRNCALCRVMRGMAFGGLGAAVGGFGALWLGAPRQTALMAAVVGAAAMVLGLAARAK
ncbi:MAG: hypothetical protein N3A55_10205 [Methylohalobius sp.]|nr:hypothetical protein [Methylohalobius sp.]